MKNESPKNGSQEDSLLVVFVTSPDQDSARRIARALVEEKLVACVNIFPAATSVFCWEGKIEEAAEALMVLKTTQEKFDLLAARVKELHSYDTPEVVGIAASRIEPRYLAWARASVA